MMLRAKSDSEPAREVDSRVYAFAYLVRKRTDLPADFTSPSAWDESSLGVFFAREQAPRFRKPKYPPRVLILGCHDLILATHPSEHLPSQYVPIAEVYAIECAHFLLDAWIDISSGHRDLRLPYNGRDDRVIHEFLRELNSRILYQGLSPCDPVHFGDEVTFAMRNAIDRELGAGEHVVMSIFLAPWEHVSRRWLFATRSTAPAHWVGISNLRLLWFSDSVDGLRQPAGYRMNYVPLHEWAAADLREPSQFAMKFKRGADWDFHWPPRYAAAVADFVRHAERLKMRLERN